MTDPVTVQPTRDQLRADVATGKALTGTHRADSDRNYYPAMKRIFEAVPQLLDQLDQAEARIDRVRDQIREPWAPSPDGDVVLVETLRNILDPDCGRGPCCLGDGHDGDCRL